jgi:hypothetical protein
MKIGWRETQDAARKLLLPQAVSMLDEYYSARKGRIITLEELEADHSKFVLLPVRHGDL